MRVTRTALFVATLLVLGSAFGVAQEVSPVRGTGVVTSVNQPGSPNFDTFGVSFGDVVRYATWEPEQDTHVGEHWWAAGQKYNLFIIDDKEHAGTQAFVAWSSSEDGYLRGVQNEVDGLGEGVPNDLKKGDEVQIRWQDGEEAGQLWVTLDVFRGDAAVATFSFATKNPFG